MGTFLDLSTRLRQFVPQLAPEQAEDFVNQALRDIYGAYDEWSFLFATDYWLSPAGVTLVGLGVTQTSDVVTFTHSNLEQLGGLNNPPLTLRQLRFGITGAPLYSIAESDVQKGVDGQINSPANAFSSRSGPFAPTDVGKKIRIKGAGLAASDLDTTIEAYISPTDIILAANAQTSVGPTATFYYGSRIQLDRLYREETIPNQTALCYRVYFSPPSADFARIDHLVDQITGYEFGWEIRAADELDRMDPRRSSVTQPYQLFYHGQDQAGLPVFELWPGPTVERAFTTYYWRRGTEMVNDLDAPPPVVTDELLLMRARMLAYEWGMVADEDPRRRASYAQALNYARSRYSTEGQPTRPLGLLEQAKREDRLIYSRLVKRPRSRAVSWPVDSNFMQNHAIPPWLS